ncbi:MAG: hypothetical protein QXN15_06905 [Candidatus Jordarchaeales archaeon]|nr:hypothetical protein [Candidatus Jordarchaeia archaeon]
MIPRKSDFMAEALRSIKSRLSRLSVKTGIEVLDVSFASLLVFTLILFFLNVILLPKNVIFTRNINLNAFGAYYALQRLSLNDELLALFSAFVAALTPLMLFKALCIRRFKDSANFGEAWSKTMNCLKPRANKERGKVPMTLIILATALMVAPFVAITNLQPVIVDYAISNLAPQWYQVNMISFLASLILTYIASRLSKA